MRRDLQLHIKTELYLKEKDHKKPKEVLRKCFKLLSFYAKTRKKHRELKELDRVMKE